MWVQCNSDFVTLDRYKRPIEYDNDIIYGEGYWAWVYYIEDAERKRKRNLRVEQQDVKVRLAAYVMFSLN